MGEYNNTVNTDCRWANCYTDGTAIFPQSDECGWCVHCYYRASLTRVEAESARLLKRDGNAGIELCYDDGNNPFAREQLKVVDFGVADNDYVVESKLVEELQRKVVTLAKFIKDREWSLQGHCPEPECYRTKKDGHADRCPRKAMMEAGGQDLAKPPKEG